MKKNKLILLLLSVALFAAVIIRIQIEKAANPKSNFNIPVSQMMIFDAAGNRLSSFFDGIEPNSKIAAKLAEGPIRQSACKADKGALVGALTSLGIYSTVLAQSCTCGGGDCPCLGCNQRGVVNDCGVNCEGGPDFSTYCDSEIHCHGAQDNGWQNCIGQCGCARFSCGNSVACGC